MNYDDQSFNPPPPPLPEGGLVPAKDDLWDRTWFQWVFWIVVIILVSGIGRWLYGVL